MENPVDLDTDKAIGKSLYNKHCKSCHGKEGYGDGTKADEMNGDLDKVISHTINISVTGVDSEAAILCLKGIAEISNGSACTSANYTASHVLAAMGYDENRIESAIRISWSHLTDPIPWEALATRIAALQ